MLNVNSGHNKELMKMSHTLWEYAEYTARVRKYAEEMELAEAVERAIEECIKGRDIERISGEESSGGKEHEYI